MAVGRGAERTAALVPEAGGSVGSFADGQGQSEGS
jgi:hypothetical protein